MKKTAQRSTPSVFACQLWRRDVKGRQEAYDQYRQANDVAAGQREQELAHRCRVLLAQMEWLIRVNRYLFALIDDARDGKRANDDPMAVFSHCPRTGKPEKPPRG